MWILSFVQVLLLAVVASAIPNGLQTPAQDRKWKLFQQEQEPQYEINPNFGFRSYHQIRFEPLTVPFEQPEYPPVDTGYGQPGGYGGSSGGGGYGEESYGYESKNNFQAVPLPLIDNNNSDNNSPTASVVSPASSAPPNEFSSRRSSYYLRALS